MVLALVGSSCVEHLAEQSFWLFHGSAAGLLLYRIRMKRESRIKRSGEGNVKQFLLRRGSWAREGVEGM